MATLISNQSLLASCPCSASSFSKPFKNLQPSNIKPFPSISYPYLRLPIYAGKPVIGFAGKYFQFCNVNRRHSFKSYLAAEDSNPNVRFLLITYSPNPDNYALGDCVFVQVELSCIIFFLIIFYLASCI